MCFIKLSKHPDDMKLLFGDMDVNQAWEELKSNSTGEVRNLFH